MVELDNKYVYLKYIAFVYVFLSKLLAPLMRNHWGTPLHTLSKL